MPSFEKGSSYANDKPAEYLPIMSAEAYAELEHGAPYVYEIGGKDHSLHYFGARHSMDPDDAMFPELYKQLDAYRPDLVIVEGSTSARTRKKEVLAWLQKSDARQSILAAGETGATLKWAQEHGVDFDCPEPSENEELMHLVEKGYAHEAIFLYYMVRQAEQFYRIPEAERKQSLKEYVQPHVDTFGHSAAWPGFVFSFEHLSEIYAKEFHGDLETAAQEFLADISDPIPWKHKRERQSVTNKVAQESTLFRDRRIVKEIAQAALQHKRIFVVYGASHAVMQEPALRQLFAEAQIA